MKLSATAIILVFLEKFGTVRSSQLVPALSPSVAKKALKNLTITGWVEPTGEVQGHEPVYRRVERPKT